MRPRNGVAIWGPRARHHRSCEQAAATDGRVVLAAYFALGVQVVSQRLTLVSAGTSFVALTLPCRVASPLLNFMFGWMLAVYGRNRSHAMTTATQWGMSMSTNQIWFVCT
jgi:hypothetical protein